MSDEKVLKAYLKLFDDLFFCGSLSSRTSLVYDSNVHYYDVERVGQADLKDPGLLTKSGTRSKRKWIITIYTRDIEDRHDRLIKLVGALLHGMCRVFIILWGCARTDCLKDIKYGGKGHGYAWQDIAYATEMAVKDLLEQSLSVRTPEDLARELFDNEVKIPKERLSGWGFEYEDVRRCMNELEEKKAKRSEESVGQEKY